MDRKFTGGWVWGGVESAGQCNLTMCSTALCRKRQPVGNIIAAVRAKGKILNPQRKLTGYYSPKH